ncbi:hypothetical protein H696_06063 [Fonticula alba]|uniref:Uncharacterized protein n=1 Tax=Fonticula alba TaxID=691883 RepID=A0A058YZX4_FONAL|nr:hypothetical protein H696_06063 [Fonticula alba]KCV67544.1 hypothetical protein H696_06063 [Fonticula alba]|eukprot:XP_009498105.1 hypothetical protein H696_06063 [Fonticula alba]
MTMPGPRPGTSSRASRTCSWTPSRVVPLGVAFEAGPHAEAFARADTLRLLAPLADPQEARQWPLLDPARPGRAIRLTIPGPDCMHVCDQCPAVRFARTSVSRDCWTHFEEPEFSLMPLIDVLCIMLDAPGPGAYVDMVRLVHRALRKQAPLARPKVAELCRAAGIPATGALLVGRAGRPLEVGRLHPRRSRVFFYFEGSQMAGHPDIVWIDAGAGPAGRHFFLRLLLGPAPGRGSPLQMLVPGPVRRALLEKAHLPDDPAAAGPAAPLPLGAGVFLRPAPLAGHLRAPAGPPAGRQCGVGHAALCGGRAFIRRCAPGRRRCGPSQRSVLDRPSAVLLCTRAAHRASQLRNARKPGGDLAPAGTPRQGVALMSPDAVCLSPTHGHVRRMVPRAGGPGRRTGPPAIRHLELALTEVDPAITHCQASFLEFRLRHMLHAYLSGIPIHRPAEYIHLGLRARVVAMADDQGRDLRSGVFVGAMDQLAPADCRPAGRLPARRWSPSAGPPAGGLPPAARRGPIAIARPGWLPGSRGQHPAAARHPFLGHAHLPGGGRGGLARPGSGRGAGRPAHASLFFLPPPPAPRPLRGPRGDGARGRRSCIRTGTPSARRAEGPARAAGEMRHAS